jgi:plastocyanin
MLINGCDPATAEDHTADANVDVMFGGANPGFKYAPACIRIKAGSKVTFKAAGGDFGAHPLTGGEVKNNVATKDPQSPIAETKTLGLTMASFNFPAAGTFPYYCEVHYGLGMEGTVFVQ